MCEQDQPIGIGKRGLSRREFGALGTMAGLAACASVEDEAHPDGLSERDVSFAAPGGTMDGFRPPGQEQIPRRDPVARHRRLA